MQKPCPFYFIEWSNSDLLNRWYNDPGHEVDENAEAKTMEAMMRTHFRT